MMCCAADRSTYWVGPPCATVAMRYTLASSPGGLGSASHNLVGFPHNSYLELLSLSIWISFLSVVDVQRFFKHVGHKSLIKCDFSCSVGCSVYYCPRQRLCGRKHQGKGDLGAWACVVPGRHRQWGTAAKYSGGFRWKVEKVFLQIRIFSYLNTQFRYELWLLHKNAVEIPAVFPEHRDLNINKQ